MGEGESLMSEKKTYCWVYYEIRDGETSYGEHEAVELNGQFDSNDKKLMKLLVFKIIAENEFNMEEDEFEKDYDENENSIEESGGYRIGTVDDVTIIPKEDYEVLKKYMGYTEIDIPKIGFVFR